MAKSLESKIKHSISSSKNEKSYDPSKSAMQAAGGELKANPPSVLKKTEAKKGKKAARKQSVAIMFSKARKGK